MSKRTTELLETIRERLDDDEYLYVESIAMDNLDLISIEVSVSDLYGDDVDEYIEEVREELLELLPGGADLAFSVV